jgi:hypothetical protein
VLEWYYKHWDRIISAGCVDVLTSFTAIGYLSCLIEPLNALVSLFEEQQRSVLFVFPLIIEALSYLNKFSDMATELFPATWKRAATELRVKLFGETLGSTSGTFFAFCFSLTPAGALALQQRCALSDIPAHPELATQLTAFHSRCRSSDVLLARATQCQQNLALAKENPPAKSEGTPPMQAATPDQVASLPAADAFQVGLRARLQQSRPWLHQKPRASDSATSSSTSTATPSTLPSADSVESHPGTHTADEEPDATDITSLREGRKKKRKRSDRILHSARGPQRNSTGDKRSAEPDEDVSTTPRKRYLRDLTPDSASPEESDSGDRKHGRKRLLPDREPAATQLMPPVESEYADFSEEPDLEKDVMFCSPQTGKLEYTSLKTIADLSCWYDLLRQKRRDLVSFFFKRESQEARIQLEDSIQEFWSGSLHPMFGEEFSRGFRPFWEAATPHPRVSHLMRTFITDVQSISTSEAECERVFSSIRDDLGDHRHSMLNASLFVNLIVAWKQKEDERKSKK